MQAIADTGGLGGRGLAQGIATRAGFAMVAIAAMFFHAVALVGQPVSEPPLVPWPREIKVMPGALQLGPQSRVLAAAASLQPLATLLAQEISLATGLALGTGAGDPGLGDIGLCLDTTLRGRRTG